MRAWAWAWPWRGRWRSGTGGKLPGGVATAGRASASPSRRAGRLLPLLQLLLPLQQQAHERRVRPQARAPLARERQRLVAPPAVLLHQVRHHHQPAAADAVAAVDEGGPPLGPVGL